MKNLSWKQRHLIAQGIRAGKSNAQIAREIGVHRSTVGREIERNAGSRENYCALKADELSAYRKQDAVVKHRLQFGGVDFFTILKKRYGTYAYISHTHLNCFTRKLYNFNHWDPFYFRPNPKNRFTAEGAFSRYRFNRYSGGVIPKKSSQQQTQNHKKKSKRRRKEIILICIYKRNYKFRTVGFRIVNAEQHSSANPVSCFLWPVWKIAMQIPEKIPKKCSGAAYALKKSAAAA
jgi:hypothetical protein